MMLAMKVTSPLAAALLCLISCGAGAAMAQTSATAPTTQPAPQMAVYRWAAPRGPAQVDGFARWSGHDEVWGEDFEAPETWNAIADPGWQLNSWEPWVKAKPGRRLILSVPLLPGGWDRSGPTRGPGAGEKVSLEAGARGDYNKYFESLARQLVQRKMDDTILRLGWEFNGGWYTWRASDNPKAWAEYFRQIVTTIRAVPGSEKLVYCWNPATDHLQFPAEQAYPGDEFVDVIGIDIYDQSWLKGTYPFPKDADEQQKLALQMKAWAQWTWGGNHGVAFWTQFAQSHKKPLAVCEWGVCNRKDGHGGEDDPYFIEQMHGFIMDPANNVMFHCYFDVQAGDGHHQLSPGPKGEPTEFPKSAAKFLELFGQGKQAQ
jgi:hypothetical protein